MADADYLLQGNRQRAMVEPDGFWVLDVALSPDGRMLAAAGGEAGLANRVRQGQVRLYDISQDPPVRRAEMEFELDGLEKANHEREWPFSSVAFTRDGRNVVAVAMGTFVIWDAATQTLKDYSRPPGAVAPEVNRTDGSVAIGSRPESLQNIDITPQGGDETASASESRGRGATPPDPRVPRWRLAGFRHLDPGHPFLSSVRFLNRNQPEESRPNRSHR